MNSIATLVVLTAFCTAGILLLACVAAAMNNRNHPERKPKKLSNRVRVSRTTDALVPCSEG
jgi:hypothetical protein